MGNLNGKAAHNHVRGDSFPGFEFDEAPAAAETAEFDARKFEAEAERLREQTHRIEIESRYALEMFEAETERRRQEAGHAAAAAERELERMRLEAAHAEAPAKAEALAAALTVLERITVAAIEAAKDTSLAVTEAEVKIAANPESYKLRLEAADRQAAMAKEALMALVGGLGALGAYLVEQSAKKAPAKKAAKKVAKKVAKKAAKKVAKKAAKKVVKPNPHAH